MSSAAAGPPQSSEERRPLTASLTEKRRRLTDPLTSPREQVAKLRDDLLDAQAKLQKALRLQSSSTGSLANNKNAGHVDVDFVRTKPSKKGRMRCKTVNVKTILHSFHADFPEGCVTALMGPSGAGKTTLLDFLTGMLGDSVHASGQVALPDNDAYVPQDDRLHGFYTCQMYMEHYARLTGLKPVFDCCSSKKNAAADGAGALEEIADEEEGISNEDDDDGGVDRLIEEILSEVGLAAQKNTVVGGLFKRGLSGGQKRRLSVALEALSSPSNLFLDEPTSGLDSESALALMQYLHSYARGRDSVTGKRRRVIVTIHQPSSQIWEVIDNVVLLANGRLMYQGPRIEMNDFFAAYGHPVPVQYNPADHFIEVLFKMPVIDSEKVGEVAENLKEPEMWNVCWNDWNKEEGENKPVVSMRRGKMMQSKRFASMVIRRDPSENAVGKVEAATRKTGRSSIELTRRSFVNLFRNPVVLALRVAIYGGMSIFIGILFWKLEEDYDMHAILIARSALLYFIIAFCSSMSTAVIPFAMIDRGIVEKEVRNHLFHPALYHGSQALASIPVCGVLSVITSVIVLNMTGMKGNAGFWVILFLTFLCADATSMFVAHIAPEMISGLCISAGLMGVFTMVMGFLVTPSSFPTGTGWLYYVPFTTYSFRSLMHIEYSGMKFTEALPESITSNNITSDPQFQEGAGGLEGLMSGAGFSADGNALLKTFEMDNVNVAHDMAVLVGWVLIMHFISIFYLCWSNYKSRRIFVYSDGFRQNDGSHRNTAEDRK